MSEPLTRAELDFLHGVLDLARAGRTDELTAAIDAGVPVNLTSAAGDSLLILAAYHGHPTTVQALLSRAADPHRVNDRGQTALGAAVFRRSRDSVRALLAAGADLRGGRRSALEIAEFFDLSDMLGLLRQANARESEVASGVDLPAPGASGRTMRRKIHSEWAG